jgi:hypothetical protein
MITDGIQDFYLSFELNYKILLKKSINAQKVCFSRKN